MEQHQQKIQQQDPVFAFKDGIVKRNIKKKQLEIIFYLSEEMY